MIASSFDESNVVLNKPDSMTVDECEALSVLSINTEDGHPLIISCWKITKDELEEIQKTGRIWLTVHGSSMQPISLSGIKPFAIIPDDSIT